MFSIICINFVFVNTFFKILQKIFALLFLIYSEYVFEMLMELKTLVKVIKCSEIFRNTKTEKAKRSLRFCIKVYW